MQLYYPSHECVDGLELKCKTSISLPCAEMLKGMYKVYKTMDDIFMYPGDNTMLYDKQARPLHIYSLEADSWYLLMFAKQHYLFSLPKLTEVFHWENHLKDIKLTRDPMTSDVVGVGNGAFGYSQCIIKDELNIRIEKNSRMWGSTQIVTIPLKV